MSSNLDNLLIHPLTRLQTEQLLARPAHAVMISGPAGAGKKTLGSVIAARLLSAGSIEKLYSHPHFIRIQPIEGKEISIDQIRELKKKLRLKIPGSQPVERVILIKNAGYMSHEAQNSLLKTLEEPPEQTVIILTETPSFRVLPTISSRSRHLYARQISLDDARQYFSPTFDKQKIDQAWHLSQGNPGLLSALLNDQAEHPLKEAVAAAKSFLNSDNYGKLLVLNGFGRDRAGFEHFLDGLGKVFGALQRTTLAHNQTARAKKLLYNRLATYEARNSLAANASPKLVALHLLTSLKP